ncbi:WD repeat-containing protein 91, partial [Camellia lanceoleosa]
ISEYSKKNVCFIMFLDKQTLLKLSTEGHVPDETVCIGLWRIVIVRNLPSKDMRKTRKVPKFLSHRLFPSSRYSIWLDSKMRLQTDPMLIIEFFLWQARLEIWTYDPSTPASRNATIYCGAEIMSLEWDCKSDRLLNCLEHENMEGYVLPLGEDPPAITSLCFNHNGKILAAVATDGMIHMFDMSAELQITGWPAHDFAISSILFGPDETSIFSLGIDGKASASVSSDFSSGNYNILLL